jgi:hypothetical protein
MSEKKDPWRTALESLIGLPRMLAELDLDTIITVWVDGESFTGAVADSPHPHVLNLLMLQELRLGDVKNEQAFLKAQSEQGRPLHRVLGVQSVNVFRVSSFYAPNGRRTLNLYSE